MKKLLVTYDTVDADGYLGETCQEVEVSDLTANRLLDSSNFDSRSSQVSLVLDSLLASSELLKGRRYATDSIKDIRLIL